MIKFDAKKAAWAGATAIASFAVLKWGLGNLLDASVVDGVVAVVLGGLVYFRVSQKDIDKAIADVKGAVGVDKKP